MWHRCCREMVSWPLAVTLAVLLCTHCVAADGDVPVVGLAGDPYRLAYVSVMEQLGGTGEEMSGADLENPGTLSRYTALIIVTRGDQGQQGFGLTEAAQAAVAEFVKAGGRVLCSYGCAPPQVIMGGTYTGFGWGPDWVVADNTHPIAAGMKLGQIVRYSAYRGAVSGIKPPAVALLTEPGGRPAVTFIPYGEGAVIQTCGDLGHGGRDATSNELRYRVMLYLMYGKGQERFGPSLPALKQPLVARAELHTPRLLALSDGERAPSILQRSNNVAPLDYGYHISMSTAAEGAGGRCELSAPPGDTTFAPWVRAPLGEAQVERGRGYQLTVRGHITGLSPNVLAPVCAELRFYDADGTELSHPGISTEQFPVGGDWTSVSTQTVVPEGAVQARVALSAMLPAGTVHIENMVLRPTLTAQELFATEQPLQGRIAGHPRAIVSPEAASQLPKKATNTDQGVFGASSGSLFAGIRARADKYLDETEIPWGKVALPWPPTDMPKEGGGLSWNPLASAVSDRLKSLSVAYAATGDARYGRRAVELLLALCNWSQWYDPVNDRPSLDVGNIALAACFAYDICHDLLTPEQRTLAAEAMQRNVMVPLYNTLSAGMGNTNGYALWTAAMGLCAIATLGETPGASRCVRLAEDCLLDYWDQRANTHRTEGQGYDAWSYGLLIFLADALKRNFGVDHFDHPFLPVIPRFAVAFMANDRLHQAWLADAGGTYQYVPWHFPLTLLGAYNADGTAGWWLRETGSLSQQTWDHYKFIAFDPGSPVTERDPQRPGDVFPRAGWASLRSGWERDGTFIALQCSSAAQGHSHMDQNNFLIYRDTATLAEDCGYASALSGATREFARGAVGHNCILVDGKNQIAKRGSIPFFATTRRVDYAMGDASAAYSSSQISRAHRHLIYLKPDLLLMVDDLHAARQPRTFQWLLHPHSFGPLAEVTRDGQPMEVGAPAAPGMVEVTRGGQKMRIRFLHPVNVGVKYVIYPGAENYNAYIQADTSTANQIVLVTLLEFGDTRADGATVSVDNDQVSFTCTARGAREKVTLKLAGEAGESPHLTVIAGGETLLDSSDLTIPGDIQG